MAIKEVSFRDVVLAVEEINAKGGVMGRNLQLIVVDLISDWDLFTAKAKELILKEKIDEFFGLCCTSFFTRRTPSFEGVYFRGGG